MEFFDTVTKRHCYRGAFQNTPVPRSHLTQIVQAGLDAPSGKNAQTTRFVIVDEPKYVRTIGAMHESNKAMQQAQAFIACVERNARWHFAHEDGTSGLRRKPPQRGW